MDVCPGMREGGTDGFRHRVSLFGDKGARQSGWVYLTMFIAPWAILHDETLSCCCSWMMCCPLNPTTYVNAVGFTGDSFEEQWLIENNNHLMLRERKRKKRKTVAGGIV